MTIKNLKKAKRGDLVMFYDGETRRVLEPISAKNKKIRVLNKALGYEYGWSPSASAIKSVYRIVK